MKILSNAIKTKKCNINAKDPAEKCFARKRYGPSPELLPRSPLNSLTIALKNYTMHNICSSARLQNIMKQYYLLISAIIQ